MPDLLLQVVEESDSSAIFTIGMVVVYGECTISEVSRLCSFFVSLWSLAPAPLRFLNAPVCLHCASLYISSRVQARLAY